MDANQMEPWRNLEPFLGADVPRNEVVLLSEVKAMCAALTKPTPPASPESAGEAVPMVARYAYDSLHAEATAFYEKNVTLTAELAATKNELLREQEERKRAWEAIECLNAELAEAREQRDRLAQENLERAEAVIAQAANARSLADALKKLNNAARISGGVAGADKNLMDACENAERALSLTGTGRAVNAVLDVLEQLRVTDARLHEVAALCAATERQRDSLRDERDSLRDERERLREEESRLNWLIDHAELRYQGRGVNHWELTRVVFSRAGEVDHGSKRADIRVSIDAALSASGREGE